MVAATDSVISATAKLTVSTNLNFRLAVFGALRAGKSCAACHQCREGTLLGAFAYNRNEAIVHTDPAPLPRTPKARSSWNYRTWLRDGATATSTHYWMNSLQGLTDRRQQHALILVHVHVGAGVGVQRGERKRRLHICVIRARPPRIQAPDPETEGHP